MGIWTLFNTLVGLALLGQGLWMRRKTAAACGAVFLAFAALDVVLVSLALRHVGSIPAIGAHAVLLFPVALFLAFKGTRDLRGPASKGR